MATRETVRAMTPGQMKELAAALIEGIPSDLSSETAHRWIDRKLWLAKALRALLNAEEDFFTPLQDNGVPQERQPTLAKYRAAATAWDVPATTAICYRVRKGFTLKQHTPEIGPHLKDWKFPNESTKDCLVFWIPRLVPESLSKTVSEQLQLLAELRARFQLPPHHLSSFGSASLLAGLILTHRASGGEHVPDDSFWARTDTCRADDRRLRLGWIVSALSCAYRDWDDERGANLGGFALGVEVLGS